METLLCDALDALASHLSLGALGRLARVSTSVRVAVNRADLLTARMGRRVADLRQVGRIVQNASRRCVECGVYRHGQRAASASNERCSCGSELVARGSKYVCARACPAGTRRPFPTSRVCLRCARDAHGYRRHVTRDDALAIVARHAAAHRGGWMPRRRTLFKAVSPRMLTRTKAHLFSVAELLSFVESMDDGR